MAHALHVAFVAPALVCSLAVAQSWVPRGVVQRYHAAWAFDSARQRVVLYGGMSAWASQPTDTFEWDGTAWAARSSRQHPPSVFPGRGAMTYDAQRARTLWVGAAATWLWDGLDWSAVTTTPHPAAEADHALSYDPVRGVVVLFGGRANGTVLPIDETWEWDGLVWRQLHPTVRPTPRTGHALVWDPIRRQTLLFGGADASGRSDNQTWHWDGSTWTRRDPTYPPEPGASLVTDLARNRVVAVKSGANGYVCEWDGAQWHGVVNTLPPYLSAYPAPASSVLAFDGRRVIMSDLQGYTHAYDGAWSLVSFDDLFDEGRVVADPQRRCLTAFNGWTMEWHDGAWHAVASNHEPRSLRNHSLAHDARRARTVLFGGADASGPLDETWEWDGVDWTQRAPSNRPRARQNGAMAFDAARGQVVLFGGITDANNGTPIADTWLWDGQTWTQQYPTTVPVLTTWPALAATYDASRQRVWLFARGVGTFEWDGSDWTQRAAGGVPSDGQQPALAYDPTTARVVLATRPATTGLWAWDGTRWSALPGMAEGWIVDLAFDPERERLVLFGPEYAWTQAATVADVTPYGVGCSGARGVPILVARGVPFVPNSRFRLELASANADSVAAVVLATLPASVSVGSCTLLVAQQVAVVPLATNGGGFAELGLPIPASAALIGFVLRSQAAVADPRGALGGAFALTQGLTLQLGH